MDELFTIDRLNYENEALKQIVKAMRDALLRAKFQLDHAIRIEYSPDAWIEIGEDGVVKMCDDILIPGPVWETSGEKHPVTVYIDKALYSPEDYTDFVDEINFEDYLEIK